MNKEKTYPNYRADYLYNLRTKLMEKEVKVVDLKGVFDDVNEPVFIDECHVNDLGHNKIAGFIHDRLKDHYPDY